MSQCTAQSKRTGERCKAGAVPGRKTCRHHGGKSLAGPLSPRWKNGRDSDYLPKRMRDDYHQAIANPEYLALRQDIALVDSRITDLMRQVDGGEPGRLWAELQGARRDYAAAQRIPDKLERGNAMIAAAGMMCELIERGAGEWAAWESIFSLVERRRKLVDTDRKRLVDAQQMVRTDQAMALMGILVETVLGYVHDPDDRAAIGRELERLTA